jgi:hypothetical protein
LPRLLHHLGGDKLIPAPKGEQPTRLSLQTVRTFGAQLLRVTAAVRARTYRHYLH